MEESHLWEWKIPKSGLNSWSSRWWDKSKDGGWKISDLRSGFFAPSRGLRQNQSLAADGIRKCLFPTTQRELFIHLWKCLWTNQRKLFRYGLRQEVTSCHFYDFFHIYHIQHAIGFFVLYPFFGNNLVNVSFQTIWMPLLLLLFLSSIPTFSIMTLVLLYFSRPENFIIKTTKNMVWWD